MKYGLCMTLPRFERGVQLSTYTTFRIGGPATAFTIARSSDEVTEAAWKAEGQGLPWHVIGHGSNLLVSDNGFDGAVIVFRDERPPRLNCDGSVTVSGGAALHSLVDFMAINGLSGLENLVGIPGTVGGAICGNAGAYGTAISERLVSVVLLDRMGGMRHAVPEELMFAYRSSTLRVNNEVVLEATFFAEHADPSEIRQAIEERLADRCHKHPDPSRVPTAGSYFKNPPSDNGRRMPAGQLLEEAGCKDMRVGGAHLWHSHANIIVTDGNATAKDVRNLASEMANRVEERFGLRLMPEVIYLE
ncbi:MAG: UDP-N-acetylmuramate dehydrogenase [bacterium]